MNPSWSFYPFYEVYSEKVMPTFHCYLLVVVSECHETSGKQSDICQCLSMSGASSFTLPDKWPSNWPFSCLHREGWNTLLMFCLLLNWLSCRNAINSALRGFLLSIWLKRHFKQYWSCSGLSVWFKLKLIQTHVVHSSPKRCFISIMRSFKLNQNNCNCWWNDLIPCSGFFVASNRQKTL